MTRKFSGHFFEKFQKSNFFKILLEEAEFSHAEGQTDRYFEANSRSSLFCEAPKELSRVY
jgi:hypothetical protein